MAIADDSDKTILSSFRRFFSGTLLSRFSGFGREVVMAAFFGATPAVAAFWMAFRFSHLLRRLLGEGALHIAFVPHFEKLRAENERASFAFFALLSKRLKMLLFALTLIIEITLGIFLVAMPLSSSSREIIELTMILFPSVIFITLHALNCSLLQCQKSFFLPGASPVILNVVWIGAALFLHHHKEALCYLAIFVTLAFGLQWFVTEIPVKYTLYKQGTEKASSKALLGILRPFLLSTLGVAATQINSALDTLFARAASLDGPAVLWYALRLQQLPLALIGVALSSALLPPLTRALQENNRLRYHTFLLSSLKRLIALMLAATAAFLILGCAAVSLTYGRGAFDAIAISHTTLALLAYAAGLLPMTATLLLATAFYAQKDYKTPTILALLSVLLNITLNTLFVYTLHLGPISIALATSLASLFNATTLLFLLFKKESLPLHTLWPTTLKTLTALSLTTPLTLTLGHYLHDNTLPLLLSTPLAPFPTTLPSQLTLFTLQALLFTTLLLTLASLLRIPELLDPLPPKLRTFFSRSV